MVLPRRRPDRSATRHVTARRHSRILHGPCHRSPSVGSTSLGVAGRLPTGGWRRSAKWGFVPCPHPDSDGRVGDSTLARAKNSLARGSKVADLPSDSRVDS
jgi:hypothetical protein